MKVVHNVFERLVDLENMFACWDEFRKGKSGKPDVMAFERRLEDNVFELHKALISGRYRHGSYTTFHIQDPKHRIISKAVVRDRLVHHLVFKELDRVFDKIFIYHSYASRKNKGTHLAVRNLERALRKVSKNYLVPVFALKCDIKKFFHSISHRKLLELIESKIKDNQMLWLVREIIFSFPTVDNFPQRERERVIWNADWQFDFADIC